MSYRGSLGQPSLIGNPKYLEKKAPESQRYKGVGTRIDSGMNMRKILDQYQGSGPNAHKKKKDEFFVRLKASTLGRLLEPLVDAEESVYGLANLARDDGNQSVVSSVLPSSTGGMAPGGGGASEGNILILDLRPFEEYQQCHAYGAKHYDVASLNKSTNNFPREVYFYKGPVECDKLVVLYDEDGKSAVAAGNQFVERGIENTYVISGGFLGICAAAPHVLVGQPPSPETLTKLLSRAGLKPSGPGGSGASSMRSDAGSVRCSTAGTVRTQAYSVAGSSPGKAWK